jgi:hypothetical protein
LLENNENWKLRDQKARTHKKRSSYYFECDDALKGEKTKGGRMEGGKRSWR